MSDFRLFSPESQGVPSKILNDMLDEYTVPFLFPEMRDPGQQRIFEDGFRLDTAVGFDNDKGFASGRWLSEKQYEVRFRSDGWMGGHIVTFTFDEKDGLSLSHMLTLAECRAAKKKG